MTRRLVRSTGAFAAALVVLAVISMPLVAQEKSDAAGVPPITGQILGDDGRPIPLAEVVAYPMGENGWSMRASAVTDEEGRFSVEILGFHPYQINVSAPGFVAEATRDGSGVRSPYFRAGDAASIRLRKGGVVTGTITAPDGEPAVSTAVRATRIRDEEGRRTPRAYAPRVASTDDRGVYRLFGLEPGTYVVSAGGRDGYWPVPTPYDELAPVYHPASSRGGAVEIVVRAGDEVEGIDVRLRAVAVHGIAGTVVRPDGPLSGGAQIDVARASDGESVAREYLGPRSANGTFAVRGVPDGEYLVTARTNEDGATQRSTPRRVVVRGADVKNVILTLAPMASIAGRVELEPAKDGNRPDGCPKDGRHVEETVVTIYRDGPGDPGPFDTLSSNVAPDETGGFKSTNLTAGRYRVRASLASEDWYFKAIAVPGARAGGADRDVVTLATGQRAQRIVFSIGRGAAAVRGKVTASEGARLPDRLRVCLVPADAAFAEEPLRYFETRVEPDGTFAIRHVAPGTYTVVARAASAPETAGYDRPAAWTKEGRAALRREAAKGTTLELKACQRVSDVVVRFTPVGAI